MDHIDPVGPDTGSYRVLRGGSWDGAAQYLRSACRFSFVPGSRFNFVGFRLVRSPLALGHSDPRPLAGAKSRAKPRRATLASIAAALERIEDKLSRM